MNGTCDDMLIDALLSEPSIAAAARAAGVARQTIYNRLHDPEFVTAAVGVLGDALAAPLGVNTAERLRAADITLRHLL